MIIISFMLIFLFGSSAYGLLEIIWRGRTHWSMLLCGGICFCLMYLVSAADIPFLRKCLFSTAAITGVEFFTGCLVNRRLRWNVWDYSAVRFNVLGQICPLYSLMWFVLSIPGIGLCQRLHTIL